MKIEEQNEEEEYLEEFQEEGNEVTNNELVKKESETSIKKENSNMIIEGKNYF